MSSERAKEVARAIDGLYRGMPVVSGSTLRFIENLPEFPPEFQPAPPLTRERIEEALDSSGYEWCADLVNHLFAALSTPQPWIKCSERMPNEGEAINFFMPTDNPLRRPVALDYNKNLHTLLPRGYWQPRYVPAPPVEEETMVQELEREFDANSIFSFSKFMEIVKRHEAKGGKA